MEHNQAEGIDPSTVKFDAAGETRLERMQAKADSAREKAELSQTDKMTEVVGHADGGLPALTTPRFSPSAPTSWPPRPAWVGSWVANVS